MIYIAIDHIHPVSRRPMPNGIPKHQHDQLDYMDGRRLDFPRIIYYLRDCKIPARVISTADAPNHAWYPIVVGWFDFSQDYFGMISNAAVMRIKKKEMKLIFKGSHRPLPDRVKNQWGELTQGEAATLERYRKCMMEKRSSRQKKAQSLRKTLQ